MKKPPFFNMKKPPFFNMKKPPFHRVDRGTVPLSSSLFYHLKWSPDRRITGRHGMCGRYQQKM